MPSDGIGSGGGIAYCDGTIQNNIIRNNHAKSAGSAFYGCSGVIRNNLVHDNGDIAISACSGAIENNTMYNNGGGFSRCEGEISNNIVWWDTTNDNYGIHGDSSVPSHCLIKGYTGPGEGNIDADPKFIDPEKGDFRLKPDSPAIDAGKAVPEVKADLLGVQRGQKAKAVPLGDGSNVDIGAHEFIPKPVAVWLPGGGPDEINAGEELAVAWETEIETAGTAVALRLQRRGVTLFDFGPFFSATGASDATVALPADLVAAPDYTIQAVSSYNPALSGQSPPLAILSPYSALPGGDWSMYR
jgi:hypothetical protein